MSPFLFFLPARVRMEVYMANENNKMLAEMVINRIKNLVPNADVELVQRPIGSDKDGVLIRFNLGSLSPEFEITEDIQELLSSSDDDFLEWYYGILEKASSSQPESSFIDWVNSLTGRKKEDILPYLIPRVRRAGIVDSRVAQPLCYGIDMLLYIVNSDYPDYGIPLTENMAKVLGLDIPEAFNYVREKRFEYSAENVVDVLRNAGMPIDDSTMLPLIVVGLSDGGQMPNSAGVLASRPCMEELEDRFGELIIFPSSIHEILVVPRGALDAIKGNKNALTEMVRDINASTVKPFEQLADNVYLYHDGELSVF